MYKDSDYSPAAAFSAPTFMHIWGPDFCRFNYPVASPSKCSHKLKRNLAGTPPTNLPENILSLLFIVFLNLVSSNFFQKTLTLVTPTLLISFAKVLPLLRETVFR